MIELSSLLAKYKNIGSERKETIRWIQEAIKECCSIDVPLTQISVDQRRGDVRIAVSGAKRVRMIAIRDELSKRISERFGEAYKVK
jgi:hypothetical protein